MRKFIQSLTFTIIGVHVSVNAHSLCFTDFTMDTARAEFIFIGKIDTIEYYRGVNHGEVAFFLVEQSFNGFRPWDTMHWCYNYIPVRKVGYKHFEKGSRYLVFANADCYGMYSTLYCSPLESPIGHRYDLSALGEPNLHLGEKHMEFIKMKTYRSYEYNEKKRKELEFDKNQAMQLLVRNLLIVAVIMEFLLIGWLIYRLNVGSNKHIT